MIVWHTKELPSEAFLNGVSAAHKYIASQGGVPWKHILLWKRIESFTLVRNLGGVSL
jgi:hypothetical protein